MAAQAHPAEGSHGAMHEGAQQAAAPPPHEPDDVGGAGRSQQPDPVAAARKLLPPRHVPNPLAAECVRVLAAAAPLPGSPSGSIEACSPPRVLVIRGVPQVGKTTLAAEVAELLLAGGHATGQEALAMPPPLHLDHSSNHLHAALNRRGPLHDQHQATQHDHNPLAWLSAVVAAWPQGASCSFNR
jgi:hypothetical protein